MMANLQQSSFLPLKILPRHRSLEARRAGNPRIQHVEKLIDSFQQEDGAIDVAEVTVPEIGDIFTYR